MRVHDNIRTDALVSERHVLLLGNEATDTFLTMAAAESFSKAVADPGHNCFFEGISLSIVGDAVCGLSELVDIDEERLFRV